MSMELKIIDPSALSQDDRAELDANIESLIAGHKNNRQEINRLVFESVSAMTTGDEYERQLSNKKGLRRFIGGITGSNKALQDKINSNRAMVQYAAQQTLQRLAEQNLMSFDLITAVNNKLNASVVEIEGEINEVYATLAAFFKQSRSDVIQLENRVERLERNVNLLNWQNSIEYQMFDGVEYADLDDTTKIVCLVRDFYDITKGDWTTSDLLLLKTAMGTIGLVPSKKTSYASLILDIATKKSLSSKLFNNMGLLSIPPSDYYPILYGIGKMEESLPLYMRLLDSVQNVSVPSLGNILTLKIAEDAILSDLQHTAQINFQTEVTNFDLIAELLFDLREISKSGYLFANSELLYRAKSGDSKAMLTLCEDTLLSYDRGFGVYMRHYLDISDSEKIIQSLYWLQKSAELGEIRAILGMGNLWMEQIPALSYYWYRKGAIAGNLRCMICLARDIISNLNSYNGHIYGSEETAFNEAVYWYEQAMNHPEETQPDEIMLELGETYDSNQAFLYIRNDEERKEKAIYWYKRAAELGNGQAQYILGNKYCHKHDYDVEEDIKQAIYWYTKSADQGNADAQYALGDCYTYRQYCEEPNPTEAFKWYKKAAEQECADGKFQYELGRCYECGYGVGQNMGQALEWYRKAAEQNYADAQLRLGLCYKDGEGVEKDLSQAVVWFKKAAQSDNADAMSYLGDCYYHGWGAEKDVREAFHWYEKAGDTDSYAMRRVADYYLSGEGVWRQDKLKAVQWYAKAADCDDPYACYYMGKIFLGMGDKETAKELLKRADGIDEAKECLRNLL